jgi:hypothetical protein
MGCNKQFNAGKWSNATSSDGMTCYDVVYYSAL